MIFTAFGGKIPLGCMLAFMIAQAIVFNFYHHATCPKPRVSAYLVSVPKM